MVPVERIDSFLRENKRRNPHYNVAPRYTAGSPALVREEIALRVAQDEEGGHQHANVGRYGQEKQVTSKEIGLSGIVELRAETKKGWDVLDVITGERFIRAFKS